MQELNIAVLHDFLLVIALAEMLMLAVMIRSSRRR